ncbi:Mu-like prophage major head subunit gpT family protein [Sulfuricurvum sp.]|uniref:phage major capsid protein n=1 Tax=Sulfuricurvum sp. TaxID=2025608 RepID=UPI002E30D1B3|nr:Mu-like prophage major head subunit gpT family protein [Sulfuricurvum sp.]HEX5330797.1 Mu-like prophage major head subunit gpT family protein [Sulfuricurvum sp.]
MPKKLSPEKLLENSDFVRAQIEPGSVNADERRVAILISTETPVRRYDYWSGQYYEEVLLHGDENVDLTRAATAKLRWMHGSGKYGELPIGKLENVTLANRQLRAEAVFSQANPDADMFWRMVEEGTLTEISVGGSKMDNRVTERDGSIALVEVTRWAFHEASLVDIGADPSAGIGRSENQTKGEIVNEKLEALQRQLEELKNQGADQSAIERKNQEIQVAMTALADENKELKRVAGIRELIAAKPGVMGDDDVKRFLDDKAKTADDLARAMLDKATESQTNVPFQRGEDTPNVYVIGQQNHSDMMRAIGDSLIMRAGLNVTDAHKDVDQFRGASMLEIARMVTGYSGYDKNELIKRAMSTSDFPTLLGNVANRVLSVAYEEEAGTFDMWTIAEDVADFKTRTEASRDRLGGRLRKLTEGGEKKNKETSESAESWRIYSYGESLKINREMLINDDLGAFNNIILDFGAMAKRTANGLVYDLLQSKGEYAGYKMADNKAIFDAAHANYTSTGTALSTDSLTVARTLMRRQKDKSGTALSIAPKFLIVAPEQETLALQLITSETQLGQANAGVKNPFRNAVDVIVESELAATAWYMAAVRRTLKVGYLQGTNRRPIVAEKSRDLSGVEYECVFDFGVFAEDFRGLYKNNGQ